MTASRKLSRRQFLVLTGGTSAAALLAACAPPAGTDVSTGQEAAPAEGATINLIAWFTDRSTINEMTETVAIPEFEAANEGIRVEMQFVPESELQQKLLTA